MNGIGAYGSVNATATLSNETYRTSRKTDDNDLSDKKVKMDSVEISEKGEEVSKSSKYGASVAAKAQTEAMLRKMISEQLSLFKQTSLPGAKPLKDVNFSDLENDDYYGIDATANRMFDNAIKMSGGSKEGMQKFKELTERAYKECEQMWGGSLPDICYKTRDKLYEMFDSYTDSDDSSDVE